VKYGSIWLLLNCLLWLCQVLLCGFWYSLSRCIYIYYLHVFKWIDCFVYAHILGFSIPPFLLFKSSRKFLGYHFNILFVYFTTYLNNCILYDYHGIKIRAFAQNNVVWVNTNLIPIVYKTLLQYSLFSDSSFVLLSYTYINFWKL
jgi:hypothetical protein